MNTGTIHECMCHYLWPSRVGLQWTMLLTQHTRHNSGASDCMAGRGRDGTREGRWPRCGASVSMATHATDVRTFLTPDLLRGAWASSCSVPGIAIELHVYSHQSSLINRARILTPSSIPISGWLRMRRIPRFKLHLKAVNRYTISIGSRVCSLLTSGMRNSNFLLCTKYMDQYIYLLWSVRNNYYFIITWINETGKYGINKNNNNGPVSTYFVWETDSLDLYVKMS